MDRNNVVMWLVILALGIIIGLFVLVAEVLHLLPLGPHLTTILVLSLLGLLTFSVKEVLRVLGVVAGAPEQDE